MTITPDYLLNNTPAKTEKDSQMNQDHLMILENNGFFPDIALRDFEARYHVNSSYSTERKLNLLQIAIQQTNGELMDQVCKWNKSGYYGLSVVPAQIIGECSELMLVYRQAVYAKAMALLTDRYRGTDTSKYGHQKADAQGLEHVSNEYDNEFRQAIYTLTGRSGQSVFAELI